MAVTSTLMAAYGAFFVGASLTGASFFAKHEGSDYADHIFVIGMVLLGAGTVMIGWTLSSFL